MDKNILYDLQEISKALKAAIVRSQNGIAALGSLAKLGPNAMTSSAPNIFNELHALEIELQRLVRAYKDQLSKASVSMPPSTSKEPE